MKAVCCDCGEMKRGTEGELIDLGWLGVLTQINQAGVLTVIKFELCPIHATGGRFAQVLKEKAKAQGINLEKEKNEVKQDGR